MRYLADVSQIHHFVEVNDEEWGNRLMDMAFQDRRSRARSAADISIYSRYVVSTFCVCLYFCHLDSLAHLPLFGPCCGKPFGRVALQRRKRAIVYPRQHTPRAQIGIDEYLEV